MKLIMACVAALSLAACADDVPTSGDSEVSVVGTKADQNPQTRDPLSRYSGIVGSELHFRMEDVRFSERVGTWAESLFPDNIDIHTCVNCEILVNHTSDGRVDDAELWTLDGNFICRIRQTAVTVLENSCTTAKNFF